MHTAAVGCACHHNMQDEPDSGNSLSSETHLQPPAPSGVLEARQYPGTIGQCNMIFLRALLEHDGMDASELTNVTKPKLREACAQRNLQPCRFEDFTADAWTKLQTSVSAGQRIRVRTEAGTATRVVPRTLNACTVQQLRTILKVSGATSVHEGLNKDRLILCCAGQNLGPRNLKELSEEEWQGLQTAAQTKKRQREQARQAREEDMAAELPVLDEAEQDDEAGETFAEVRNPHVETIPWPFQGLRMQCMRIQLERKGFRFKAVCEAPSSEAAGSDSAAAVGTDSWRDFTLLHMLTDTRHLPHGNHCMMTVADFRVDVSTLNAASIQTTYQQPTLSNYTSRSIEFLEFVFRRLPLVWPLCSPANIQNFYRWYVRRPKKRTSLAHAHNTTATHDMVKNLTKALNWLSAQERSDKMWTHIMHDDFPIGTFQFPAGYLPLIGRKTGDVYAPASGDAIGGISKRLSQLEGENMSKDALPHPSMLSTYARVGRSDYMKLVEAFLQDDLYEMAASETHATQALQRKFCLSKVEIKDLMVWMNEEDRDMGQVTGKINKILVTMIIAGKGNSAGCKREGVMRHKMLWACSVSHLAWLFFKRYVWCIEKEAPFFNVSWEDPLTWSKHKVIGNGYQDPTVGLAPHQISGALSTLMRDVLQWSPARVSLAKKNQGNRKEGANMCRLLGAGVAEIGEQGGWTGQHSSGQEGGAKTSVLQSHYLAAESNVGVMKAAAGYKAHEDGTDAGGRANIKYDTVSGSFFGPIILRVQNTFDAVRVTWVYPYDIFAAPLSPSVAHHCCAQEAH